MDPSIVIPWYRSAILQGIMTSVIAQALAHSKLSAFITSDQAVQLLDYGLDALSAAALAYAAHSRVSKPLPPVAISKAAATKINIANANGDSNAKETSDSVSAAADKSKP